MTQQAGEVATVPLRRARGPGGVAAAAGVLLLGVAAWLFACSDWELPSRWLNIAFPFVGLAIASRYRTRKYAWPAIAGCVLLILGPVVEYGPTLPGFAIWYFFIPHQALDGVPSPDGKHVAQPEVFGALGSGLEVSVIRTGFPLLRRAVFLDHAENVSAVGWKNNDTLVIGPHQTEIHLAESEFSLPKVLSIPLSWSRDPAEAKVAREGPVYPLARQDERSFSYPSRNTFVNSYQVTGHTPDEVSDWYGEALAKTPWRIVRRIRKVRDPPANEENDHYDFPYKSCFEATRAAEGARPEMAYFVEVLGHSPSTPNAYVNVATPHAPSRQCFNAFASANLDGGPGPAANGPSGEPGQ